MAFDDDARGAVGTRQLADFLQHEIDIRVVLLLDRLAVLILEVEVLHFRQWKRLFYGDRVVFGHGSAGGWDPFGPRRLVTRSKGNILYELDGKPALTALAASNSDSPMRSFILFDSLVVGLPRWQPWPRIQGVTSLRCELDAA